MKNVETTTSEAGRATDRLSDTLAQELAEWQTLGTQAWEQFPFEDEAVLEDIQATLDDLPGR